MTADVPAWLPGGQAVKSVPIEWVQRIAPALAVIGAAVLAGADSQRAHRRA
jgi:hypothetical protein